MYGYDFTFETTHKISYHAWKDMILYKVEIYKVLTF